jgi:hypothetical protein
MSISPYRKALVNDPEVRKVQDSIEPTIRDIVGKSILDGLLLEDISLSSGSNIISHRLGRVPRGWIVVRKSSTATIYDNSIDEYYLNLTASAVCRVSLWVF